MARRSPSCATTTATSSRSAASMSTTWRRATSTTASPRSMADRRRSSATCWPRRCSVSDHRRSRRRRRAHSMDYRRLGRSGLKVSEICLGTMTFGNGADEAEAARMVHAAFDAGVNFFDTADAYVNGVSEDMLGKALKGRRSDAVIASKVFNPMGGRPNDSGMSRLHIKQAVEDSLRRLQTDYIDVYYIHHVDIQTPLEEMLRAFDDLVRQGKILYTACSNYET